MANVPIDRPLTTKMRRGFGLDPIKSDTPFGSAASLLIHGGILLSALWAWQVTPRIMPEDVIAVDMVSDTPSVKGENTTAETAQTGVDTAMPSPIPQTTLPAQAQPLPAPVSEPQAALPPEPARADIPAPASLPQAEPLPATPRQPGPLPATPSQTPRPAPQPAPQPAPKVLPKVLPKALTKVSPQVAPKTSPAARSGQRQAAATAPLEFDLAAASNAATGADSGGRRSPQLASRGQAGRLGKAGGGAQLTGDLEAALRSQIKECWLEPANMSNAASLLVVVSMDIGIDGRLQRDPILVSPSSRAGANPALVVAIDNAMRAVRDCAPYNLPPDRYDSWRQVRFNFDPRRMTAPR